MKTLKRNLLIMLLLTGGVFAFSQCTKIGADDGLQSQVVAKSQQQDVMMLSTGNGKGNGHGKGNGPGNGNGQGSKPGNGNGSLSNCISTLPVEPLSNAETAALNQMREEELLAHDVYAAMYAKYKLPAFKNIAESETQHAEAVKALLVKYALSDPAAGHVPGVFADAGLQALYTALIAKGNVSLGDALIVGATIEDLDIYDLQKHLATDVDNKDITFVFSNLEKGSRNHLRSFYRLLTSKGLTYVPQYISTEYFNQIVTSPTETGSVSCP